MIYSVAIRTLAKSLQTLQRELESISRQTVQPDKVVIYIAEGCPLPPFNVMGEIYITTPKGMVSQRAVDYAEVDSELVMLLDDDVELAPDSAKILIGQLKANRADCVAADTFGNHRMTFISKVKAAVGNWVFPRFDKKWAFKLHSNGSFSYINNPISECYPSQSAAGPAALWKKKSLLALDFKAETWLDQLGFAYGDDDLEFFKLHINGGRLFVSFNSGIKNLDAKTASTSFQANERKYYIRAMSNHIRWYRMQYQTRPLLRQRIKVGTSYWLKQAWVLMLHIGLSFVALDLCPLRHYLKGIKDGRAFIKSSEYRKIPEYKNENIILR